MSSPPPDIYLSFIKRSPAQIRSVYQIFGTRVGWPSFCPLSSSSCSPFYYCSALPLFVQLLRQNPLQHRQVAEGRLSCLKTCPRQSFSFLWALLIYQTILPDQGPILIIAIENSCNSICKPLRISDFINVSNIQNGYGIEEEALELQDVLSKAAIIVASSLQPHLPRQAPSISKSPSKGSSQNYDVLLLRKML